MKPLKRLRNCIESILGDDFLLVTDPSFPVYEKRFASGRIAWVSLEKPSDEDELCIELKEFEGEDFNPNLPNDSIWLSEFKGLRGYFFSKESPIEEVLTLIEEHMKEYGTPWLRGEKVSTPELDEAKRKIQVSACERNRKEAREKFKNKEYEDCLALYREIEKHIKLENLDEKYKSIASKRQA